MGSLAKSRYADPDLETFDRVNRDVNSTRTFEKGKEGWQLNTLKPGDSGDCDSFAATKIGELKRAGVPLDKVNLDVYKLWDGQDHAVVTVNHNGKHYFLDNRNDDMQEEAPGKLLRRVPADELDQFRQSLSDRKLLKA